MASVIRVNTINSRSGLSTVTFDNSGAGVEVAGIVTATSFTGTLNTAAQGNITSLGTLTGLTIDNNADTSMSSSSAGQLKVSGNGYTGAIALDGDAMHIYHNSSIRDIVFGINESEKVRIDTAGKVGIGSTVPKLGLDINKGANSGVFLGNPTHGYQLRANVTSSHDYGLMIEDEDGIDLYRAVSSTGSSTDNVNTHTWWTAGEERLRIKSDGDIETDGNLKTNNIPGRNKFINGNFHVWQRGTSSTAGGYVAADRWYHNLSGANMTFSRQTHTDPIDGSRYYARLASTSSDDYCGFRQRVEDAASIPEGKVTVSFWARGHVNGNLAVWGTIHYGSGGSADVDIAEQRTPYLQNDSTFRKYSLTFTIPSHSGKTFGANNYFEMAFGQGTGDSASAWTLDISNIQLEIGSIATAFEQRTFAEELRLCQRYYLAYSRWMGGSRASSTTRSFTVPTPTPMRLCGNPSTGAMTNAASANGDVGYVGSTRQKGDISVNSITMSTTSGVSAMQANVTSSYAVGSADGGMVFGMYLPGFTIDHEL